VQDLIGEPVVKKTDDMGVQTQMNPKERQNVMECFNVAQDRVNWQNLTNEVMNILVSLNIRIS
jgi:uncharacterized protein (DUF2236 family)